MWRESRHIRLLQQLHSQYHRVDIHVHNDKVQLINPRLDPDSHTSGNSVERLCFDITPINKTFSYGLWPRPAPLQGLCTWSCLQPRYQLGPLWSDHDSLIRTLSLMIRVALRHLEFQSVKQLWGSHLTWFLWDLLFGWRAFLFWTLF